MNGHDRLQILRVAAAHGDDDGDVGVAAAVEDERVAPPKTIDGQFQTPQPITLIGVGARKIENRIGVVVEDHIQAMCKRGQIRLIAGAILQFDIEIALLFLEGVVLAPCSDSVKTLESFRKIAAVPSPW